MAPSLIPKSTSGRRVKTDSRDAEQLAKLLGSGDLVAIWVTDEEDEAFREMVRARSMAKRDVERHRHQLVKLRLRWACGRWSASAGGEALPALAGRAEPQPPAEGRIDGGGRLPERAGKSLCGRCPIPLERCTPLWASELGSSAASPVCGTLQRLLQWGGPR